MCFIARTRQLFVLVDLQNDRPRVPEARLIEDTSQLFVPVLTTGGWRTEDQEAWLGGGSFFLACEDFGGRLDESFPIPACAFFFFF